MKIQQKLTFNSSLVFGIVFLVSSAVIYISFTRSAERVYYNSYAQTARLAAIVYLEKDEMTRPEHKKAEEKFKGTVKMQEIRIFNTDNHIEYGDAVPDSALTPAVLDQIRRSGKLDFRAGDTYFHGLSYHDNQGNFVIVVSERKSNFLAQKQNLILILIITFITGLVVIVIVSYSLSSLAYKPVREIITQVNAADLNNRQLRLTYPASGDELEALIASFDKLLLKLQESFRIRKNFIDHASHELRTPLAAIIGDLEVALHNNRSAAELRSVCEAVLKDASRLESIIQNLLVLSAPDAAESRKSRERIDEILWEVLDKINGKYPSARLDVKWELPEDNQAVLLFHCDRTQLYMALFNLVDNAVKFSAPHPVTICLKQPAEGGLLLIIRDKGPGIPAEDLAQIDEPFYRGRNTTHVAGHGLGLTIARLIFSRHQVTFRIGSGAGGTQITLGFPVCTAGKAI